MELKIYSDYNNLSAAAADMIIDCVKTKPDALLCFATGDTPKLAYQLVAEKAIKDKVDFSRSFIIGLDEWMGIPPDNTGSCHWFLHVYLFKPLNIDPSQIHLFNAFAKNEEAECKKMNKLIAVNGIDLMVVGVGMNGHIGFNEPGTDINSLAHVATLDETTVTVGQKYFKDKVSIGKGITVGLKQVMQTEKLLMMANGKKKAPVIKRAVEENVSNIFPATLIQQHKNAFLMIDDEAASELKTELK
ncbi:MAG TPA: glucosamine-6-phosphate deaminase [Chitinophagaceae bacterium]|nr:glucosamine-6-phosphate deaminase [Chitinophagaceae bacterium]